MLLSNFQCNSWHAILIVSSIWSALYFILRYLFPEKSPEWHNRALTFCHGIAASVNGIPDCFSEKLFVNTTEPQTSKQQFILLISLGYFIFDFLWCLYYQTDTVLMIVHHGYSCAALTRVLYKNVAGTETCCGLGGLEVTNPLLQARWFLRSEGYHNTLWFTCVEFVFAVFFFIMRAILGTLYTAKITYVYKKNFDLEYRLITAGIYIISQLFVIGLVRYIYNKYRHGIKKPT